MRHSNKKKYSLSLPRIKLQVTENQKPIRDPRYYGVSLCGKTGTWLLIETKFVAVI